MSTVRIQRDGCVSPSSPPPAPTIARLIDGNAVDPGSQVRFTTKLTDALKRPQKRFLCQVARFFAVFSQAIKQAIDLAGALGDQDFEGGRVALLQSFNELGLIRGPHLFRGRRGNLL